jgi:general secretion pathway protein A
MYTDFFGLLEKPFELSPDPRYLFLSASHREVLGHLIYGIEQREGFIAITGEVGTGKTTLCRTLLERLSHDCEVAYLFNPHLSPIELLKAINSEFGLSIFGDSMPELVETLNEFLLDKKAEGRNVLLIIDEAQTLSTQTLEQLRLLSNLETSTAKLLQIVLLGQPELEDKLATHELRQLRQRIALHWHLGPLASAETREYVQHRLRVAAERECRIFTEDALAAVHRVSGGVPRLINLVCERALLAAYGDNVRQVDRRLIRTVAVEIWPRRPRAPRRRLARAAWIGLALGVPALGFAAGFYFGAPALDVPRAGVATAREPRATPPEVSMAPPHPSARASAMRPLRAAEPEGRADESGASVSARVLDDLLPLQSDASANAAALAAALEAWRLPSADVAPLERDALPGAIAAHEFERLPVSEADLDALRQLDLPAILWLHTKSGETRAVLLQRVDAEQAFLRGLLPGETVRIAADTLLERWRGDAYVLWRDFAGLPALIAYGDDGPQVAWLQRALARTGHFGGIPHGGFDEATRMAVRSFQLDTDIEADGRVGPRTKIRLYQSLGDYATPALVPDPDPSS